MVLDEEPETFHSVDEIAEIVDQAFAIEEIIGREEKVPGQAAEPR